MLMSFVSCDDKSSSVEERLIKKGYWQLRTQEDVRYYETYYHNGYVESGLQYAIDSTYESGARVFRFDDDSLRIYSEGIHLESFMWMLQGNELVLYKSYVHPDFGEIINIWHDFNIEKLNAYNLNLLLTQYDTVITGDYIKFYELNVDMSFENINSLSN